MTRKILAGWCMTHIGMFRRQIGSEGCVGNWIKRFGEERGSLLTTRTKACVYPGCKRKAATWCGHVVRGER